jgi:thymidine kinase
MAKLYFYYSTMNAGKSTLLLQSNHNYQERGMKTLILTPKIDTRFEENHVHSRIGLKSPALGFEGKDNLYDLINVRHEESALSCIFVDEAQFLNKQQVNELSDVVDILNIPVICYGLRNDFQAEPFEGSIYLLTWADELTEVKTVCHCGRKANHVVRLNEAGQVVKLGQQVEIGGNDKYVSMCRKHFKQAFDQASDSLTLTA